MSMCGLLACGALCADFSPARMNALGALKDTSKSLQGQLWLHV
jgi:hypothetical protein